MSVTRAPVDSSGPKVMTTMSGRLVSLRTGRYRIVFALTTQNNTVLSFGRHIDC
jgi:mRNA-degrading endonuclease RelE of RelBE toxin-antitoxin system